jgi:hypothetical protein
VSFYVTVLAQAFNAYRFSKINAKINVPTNPDKNLYTNFAGNLFFANIEERNKKKY